MTRPTHDARFRTLAEHALAKTEAGALGWEETPQEEAFVAILGSGMLKTRRADRLAPSPTDEQDSFYEEIFEVELLTRTGEPVLEEVFDGFEARRSLGGPALAGRPRPGPRRRRPARRGSARSGRPGRSGARRPRRPRERTRRRPPVLPPPPGGRGWPGWSGPRRCRWSGRRGRCGCRPHPIRSRNSRCWRG